MPQSLSKIWTHLIFSTKDRYPFLSEPFRSEMHGYLASILKAHHCPTLIVGGVSDHVHALFVLSKNDSIANIVYELKRSSSKWAKTQVPTLRKFSLAERIRRLLGQRVTHRCRQEIYREAGTASHSDDREKGRTEPDQGELTERQCTLPNQRQHSGDHSPHLGRPPAQEGPGLVPPPAAGPDAGLGTPLPSVGQDLDLPLVLGSH